jgi:hypothetical protein
LACSQVRLAARAAEHHLESRRAAAAALTHAEMDGTEAPFAPSRGELRVPRSTRWIDASPDAAEGSVEQMRAPGQQKAVRPCRAGGGIEQGLRVALAPWVTKQRSRGLRKADGTRAHGPAQLL